MTNIINKRETVTINCSNSSCKKPLLIVHHTPYEDNFVNYKIRVQCPYCPRRGYDFEVKGDIKYVTIEGVLLTAIKEVEEDGLVIIETQKAE